MLQSVTDLGIYIWKGFQTGRKIYLAKTCALKLDQNNLKNWGTSANGGTLEVLHCGFIMVLLESIRSKLFPMRLIDTTGASPVCDSSLF